MITSGPLSARERHAVFAYAVTIRGISRAAGAEALGVTWTHLQSCFSGPREPGPDLMVRVAEFVGVPVENFWGQDLAQKVESAARA